MASASAGREACLLECGWQKGKTLEMKDTEYKWPYGNESGREETVESDVLVLGGGLSGCFAAIAAARKGQSVVLVEKGAIERSGAAGTGFDHWESACTNPCCGVTPKEIAEAYVREQDWYSNGIAHYIECREGYDRLLDIESFGGKIRDTEDEFAGAEFRDEENKLMFAYDYRNKFTIRVWGSTFKPALYRELKRLGVRLYERTEATGLLVSRDPSGVRVAPEPWGCRCGQGSFMCSGRNPLSLPCPGLPGSGCSTPTCRDCANSGLSRASAAAMPWAGGQGWNLP